MDRLHQRITHRLVGLLAGIVLFSIGLVNVLRLSGRPAWLRDFLQQFLAIDLNVGRADYRWWMLLFWILVVMLPVFQLALFLARAVVRRSTLVLRTEGGYPLRIRKKAIQSYVRDRLRELDSVEHPSVEVSVEGRKGLRIRLEVSAAIEKSAASIEREIRESIEVYVRQGLGVDKVIVEPEFTRLIPASRPVAPASTVVEDDSELVPAGLPPVTPAFGESKRSDVEEESGEEEEEENR